MMLGMWAFHVEFLGASPSSASANACPGEQQVTVPESQGWSESQAPGFGPTRP